MKKIRILHVAQAAGGVDRYIRMLLKYLDVKESFAVGTLISAIVWYFISETDFRYLKIKIKTKAFLFVELVTFLFFGLKVDSAVYGCIVYVLVTIIMSFVLMQDTMVKICNALRKKYQRSINE